MFLWKKCIDVISGSHEDSLTKILLDNSNGYSEADMTVTLAEHLFKQLAPVESYVIDNGTRGKSGCKCILNDCLQEEHFGDTGIGRNQFLLLSNLPD